MSRTRFAPSPTGSLHAGSVRTALYCLLHARQTGAEFLLRIEDTDRMRSSEEASAGILRDFAWLGLTPDEGPAAGGPAGPYVQSERLDLYTQAAERLLDAGLAYEAWDTAAELSERRQAAQAAQENFRYRGGPVSEADGARFRAEGRTPVVRFKAPRRDVTVADQVLGDVTVQAEVLDDLVIVKADGWPTYHFAVVVDDHHMNIGLVLRGNDHLMNTHKHVQLYEALGWDAPEHGHLPLIFNANGSRMSKRDKAKAARAAARDAAKAGGHAKGEWEWLAQAVGAEVDDVARFMAKKHNGLALSEAIAAHLGAELPLIEVLDFRRAGYLPEALVNYMALLGWSPGDDRELMTLDEMVEAFSLSRVTKTPARFDPDKLAWMNGQYMQRLPMDVLMERLASWLQVTDSPIAAMDPAKQATLLQMYRPRVKTFQEIERLGAFFFAAPMTYTDKQVRKHVQGDGWVRLRAAEAALVAAGSWDVGALKAVFEALAAELEVGLGKVAQPVRIAVSGTGVSPDLFDTLAFVGREETLARVRRLLGTQAASH